MVNVTGRKFSFLSLVVILLVLGIPSRHAEARKLSTFGEEALSNLGHNTINGERIDISKDKLRSDDFGMFPSGPSTGAPHYEPQPTFTQIDGQRKFGKSDDFGMFSSRSSTGALHYEPEPPGTNIYTDSFGQGKFEKKP